MTQSTTWFAGQFKNGTYNTGGKRADYSTEDNSVAITCQCKDRNDALKAIKRVVAKIKRKRKVDPAYNPMQDPAFIKDQITVFLFVSSDF